MRKGVFTLLALGLSGFMAQAVAAEGINENGFNYAKAEYIIAVTDDLAHAYARFPHFIEFRDHLVEVTGRFEEGSANLSEQVYTLELLGGGERHTLFVGKTWLSDGVNVATLTAEEFAWIDGAIRFRGKNGKGIEPDELESVISYWLEEQRSRMQGATN